MHIHEHSMPIKRNTQRERLKETMLKLLEKYRLALGTVNLNTSAMQLLLAVLENRRKFSKRTISNLLQLVEILILSVHLNHELSALPRMKSSSNGDIKGVDVWDDVQFYTQFRFRKGHFWHFLDTLQWMGA